MTLRATDADADADRLGREFMHFAEVCEGQSPLYATLSKRVAREPALLDLARGARRGQPAANLLFGAVHFLLLSGVAHDLAASYPSLGGQSQSDPQRAWPDFLDFCHRHAGEIAQLVSAQRVQTNEVGRCGVLLPAFAYAHVRAHAHARLRQPLYIFEVGASAGLNLLFDRYRYEYSDGRVIGPSSPATIRTEIRGERTPEHIHLPPVTGRVGIDIAPVDVTDALAMRWLESLIWPDQLDRIDLHRQATRLAAQAPPRIVQGDAAEALPQLMAEAPVDCLPGIVHSHAIYQMTADWRADFQQLIARLAGQRDLAHISLEWLGEDPGPRLHLTLWIDGAAERRHLADTHHHGRWLRWIDQPVE
jgi:hypothetical protein